MTERDIFMRAFEEPDTAGRFAILDQDCRGDSALRARIEALLDKAGHAGSFLESPAIDAVDTATRSPSTADPATSHADAATPVGTVIGSYKLIEPLGEGGMGTVYLAEQAEPVKRRVALKLIRAGWDSKAVLARFEAERQALALMDHPNIAKVFDAGTTPGDRGLESGD